MRALVAPRPGVPLQAAVDRAHGHGLFLPSLTGDAVTASSTPWAATAVTGGTAHTKGSWVEVTNATTSPLNSLTVMLTAINYANGVDTSTLLDIGIGGAGSEVVVVPNVGVGWANQYQSWTLPVSIPQGTRIAVRAQSTRTSQNISVWVIPTRNLNTRYRSPSALVDVCANTATSYGVALSVPGAVHTKGSWTQLTASCAQALQAIVICPQGAADTNQGGGTGLIDVAVGASGSEVTVVSNWPVAFTTAELLTPPAPNLWPVNVPAGARIAARYQTGNTGASVDLQLIGVPA